jgi:hypothetical protein
MLAAQASGRSGRAQEIKSTFAIEPRKGSKRDSEAAHRVHDAKRE